MLQPAANGNQQQTANSSKQPTRHQQQQLASASERYAPFDHLKASVTLNARPASQHQLRTTFVRIVETPRHTVLHKGPPLH